MVSRKILRSSGSSLDAVLKVLRAKDGTPETLPPMSEHQQLFLKTWVERSGEIGGALPARADFPPNKFARLMPMATVLDVERDPVDFTVRLLGTGIEDRALFNYTGSRLSSIPELGPGRPIFEQLKKVLKSRVPDYEVMPYFGPRVSVTALTVLCLPLAADGKTPDKIFQIINYLTRQF